MDAMIEPNPIINNSRTNSEIRKLNDKSLKVTSLQTTEPPTDPDNQHRNVDHKEVLIK